METDESVANKKTNSTSDNNKLASAHGSQYCIDNKTDHLNYLFHASVYIIHITDNRYRTINKI